MRTEIRKTAVGTEYWDSIEKKTIFVASGSEPDFEVTENPKSMIAGVDLAKGKDATVLNGKPITSTFGISEDGVVIELSNMTIEQLKDYAISKDIEIPATVKEQEEIAKYLYENWNPNTEISLDEMDADQLRDFAKQNNIEIPFNVKKEETIRKYIEEALEPANDAE